MSLLYTQQLLFRTCRLLIAPQQSSLEHFLDKCHAERVVRNRQMLRNEARLVMLVPHPKVGASAAAHISLCLYRDNMIGRA